MADPQPQPKYTLDVRTLAIYALLFFVLLSARQQPQPNPTPTPQPPNFVLGERIVLIVQESGQQTTDTARMIYDLRDGPAAKYLAEKKHLLFVLDQDQKDANGQPLAVLTKLKPTLEGKKLPVVVVGAKTTDGKLGAVLYCGPLPEKATADNVVEIVKRNGG